MKRAYAVVEQLNNSDCVELNFCRMTENNALAAAGFRPGDEVEIRLRVAQGEGVEALRQMVKRHDEHARACNFTSCGCEHCAPVKAYLAALAAAPEGIWSDDGRAAPEEQEAPAAEHNLVGSSDEKTGPVDASATGPLHERRLCKPGDAGLVARTTAPSSAATPAALPEEVPRKCPKCNRELSDDGGLHCPQCAGDEDGSGVNDG